MQTLLQLLTKSGMLRLALINRSVRSLRLKKSQAYDELAAVLLIGVGTALGAFIIGVGKTLDSDGDTSCP